MSKAASKAVCDYAFHCIVTDISGGQLSRDERSRARRRDQLQAVHGVSRRLHARRWQHLQSAADDTAKNGGLVCMHAENGSAIDVIVQQALAEGKKAPKYHALTRPTTAEAEATARAIALAEMAGAPIYIVHLSCNDALEKVREARDRGLPVYAETCPQYLYLSIENLDAPGFEGAKYVFTPPLREKWHQEKLWNGLQARSPAGRLDRSLPVLLQGAERIGARRFHQDSQRRAGRGASHEPDLLRRRGQRTLQRESFCRARLHNSREIVWTVPAQRNDRRWQRCRPGDFRSQAQAHHQRQDASHARGLLDV